MLSKSVLLEHNYELYEQMEETLLEQNKCLVILGTGLGKTTTALEYLYRHQCRALVVVPNNIVRAGWERYEDVDVITYQGFANSYELIDYSNYGLIIYDEVHHGGAETWGNSLRWLLEQDFVPILGLTATPLRSDGIHVGDELFKGAVVEGLDVLSAVKQGILHKFSYISAYYDAPQVVHDVLEEYIDTSETLLGQLDLALNNTPEMTEIFHRHMPSGKRKGVIFCYRIEDMGEAEDLFHEAYPDAIIRRLHSNMSDDLIAENRKWFEETDEGYLLTVYMMGEGAHYPGVNTIIMLRKTQSNLVFQQQLGRCITLVKDEDPHAIVFDLVNNSKNVKNEIKAIRDAIEDLGEEEVQRRVDGALEAERNGETTPYTDQVIVRSYTEELDEVFGRIREEADDSWTEEEDTIIREFYPLEGLKTLNRLSRHTQKSLVQHAYRLGIQCLSHQWSEEELSILTQNYSIYGADYTTKLLPYKSKSSVIHKAQRLGLKKIFWTEEEISILRQYYPLEGKDVQKRIPNHTASQIMSRASILGIERHSYKYDTSPWSDSEIKILEEYYPTEGMEIAMRLTRRSKISIMDKVKELNIKRRGVHRKVRNIETGEIFDSIKEAQVSIGGKHIGGVLSNRKNTAGGYHWEYVEDDAEET